MKPAPPVMIVFTFILSFYKVNSSSLAWNISDLEGYAKCYPRVAETLRRWIGQSPMSMAVTYLERGRVPFSSAFANWRIPRGCTRFESG